MKPCARCGGSKSDSTRRHCAPCILAFMVRWVAYRRDMKRSITSGRKEMNNERD